MTTFALTRRAVVEGALALGLATATPALAEPGKALTFLAVGDWGRDGLFNQTAVAAAMGETAKTLNAAFVLSVGDNFYEDGVASVTDPKWKTSFEDIYTAPALQVPWWVALGNHDYHGSPEAEIAYSQVSNRWRMPARYYKVSQHAPDGASLDLFVIDSSPMVRKYWEGGEAKTKVVDQDVPAQLAWLEAALAASKADFKIVTGHHPIYTGGEHGDTEELVAHILPLLKTYGVAMFINGHDHDLQHMEIDGITFICSGAGSKTRPTAARQGTVFCSDRSGFSTYRFDRSGMAFRFIDYEGKVLHQGSTANARQPA